MEDFVVNAKAPKIKKEATITIKVPSTIEEAVKMYRPEAILSNALANWKVVLQGNIRAGLEKGEDQAALQARLGKSVMGVAATKSAVDPVAAYRAMFLAATPEERKKMRAELEAAAANAGK